MPWASLWFFVFGPLRSHVTSSQLNLQTKQIEYSEERDPVLQGWESAFWVKVWEKGWGRACRSSPSLTVCKSQLKALTATSVHRVTLEELARPLHCVASP